MNPPYSKYRRVLQKIVEDGAVCLLLLPVWPARIWYNWAQQIWVSKITFPAGYMFFELDGQQMPPTRWAIEVVYVGGDVATDSDQESILKEPVMIVQI